MNKKIAISFPDGSNSPVYGVFDLNESCPHCAYPIEPIMRGCYADKIFSNIYNTALLLQCPRKNVEDSYKLLILRTKEEITTQ